MIRRSDLVIPGPPLRGILPPAHTDDVDHYISKLWAKYCAEIIATRIDKYDV